MDLINEFKKRVLEPLKDPVKVKESTLDTLVATISKSESKKTGAATVEYHGSVKTPDYVPVGQYEVNTQSSDHPDIDDSAYRIGASLPLPQAEIDIHGYFPDFEANRADVNESAYIGWESTLKHEDFIKLVEWLVNHCADKSKESFEKSTKHIWEGDGPYCVLPEWVIEDRWDFTINLGNFLDFVKKIDAHGYHVTEVDDLLAFMNDFEPTLFWYRFSAQDLLRDDRKKKEKQFEDFMELAERFLVFVKEELAKRAAETAKLLPFEWLDSQIEVIKSDFKPVVKPTVVQEPTSIIEVREPPKERDTVRRLIEAGSDFLKNFFEIAFVYVDRDQNQPDRMLLTRIGSIEIPRLKAKTFQVKTIRGSVEKVASTLEGAYETTVEIRPDQDCYILDKFCEQAGVWEFKNDAWIFPATSLFNGQIGREKRHRLDILVKEISGLEHETHYVGLHKNSLTSGKWGVAVNTPDVRLNKMVTSEWILEDVKIINVVDSIQYSFSSTEPSNISLHVIAKAVDHRVY